MKTYYKGYSIEPADTIYSPEFQIVNTNDCDDFVRHVDTIEEAKLIINDILEDERI